MPNVNADLWRVLAPLHWRTLPPALELKLDKNGQLRVAQLHAVHMYRFSKVDHLWHEVFQCLGRPKFEPAQTQLYRCYYSLYPSISYIWPTMSRRKIQHFETWLVCHTTDRCGRFLWSQITILQAILDGLCIHHFCSFVSSMSPSFLTLGQHHHWIFIFISYHIIRH